MILHLVRHPMCCCVLACLCDCMTPCHCCGSLMVKAWGLKVAKQPAASAFPGSTGRSAETGQCVCGPGRTFFGGEADAEELHLLHLAGKVHGGPHPGLVAADVLRQLGARHHCASPIKFRFNLIVRFDCTLGCTRQLSGTVLGVKTCAASANVPADGVPVPPGWPQPCCRWGWEAFQGPPVPAPLHPAAFTRYVCCCSVGQSLFL